MSVPFNRKRLRISGVTLVEILLASLLLGFVMISASLSLFKMQSMGNSLGMKNRANVEIQSLYYKMRNDIKTSSGVDDGSLSKRLILRNIDANGVPYLNGYRVNNSLLEQSINLQSPSDAGATWGTPYNITSNQPYSVGQGEFLFCGYGNNCTRFTDTNANNVFDAGVDTATAVTGTALTKPSQARRIRFYNFVFDRNRGNPPVTRSLPNAYVTIGPRLVDIGPPLNWGNNPVVQSFHTYWGNYPTCGQICGDFYDDFIPRSLVYDSEYRRLLIAGNHTGGTNKLWLYASLRDGTQFVDPANGMRAATYSAISPQLDRLAFADDKMTAIGVNKSSNTMYVIKVNSGYVGSATTYALTTSASIQSGTAYGLAYDPAPGSKRYVYLLARNASSNLTMFKVDLSNGSATTNAITAGGITTTPTGGMFMDPITGDFYVGQNTTAGLLDVYKITRSTWTAGATPAFTINLAKLSGKNWIGATVNATTAGTGNLFDIKYDYETNHVFVLDTTAKMVFEVVPTRLISPRS